MEERQEFGIITIDPAKKYYVYELIDPRTYQPFYVGKGCGDRVYQHAKNAIKPTKDEDEMDLKTKQINEIILSGKEVIHIIIRWGMDEDTAYEVESACIDVIPGLTNIYNGHDHDRGLIKADELFRILNIKEYTEPAEDYIIVKTTPNAVILHGDLYEATRKAWIADINRAKKYKYVLSTIYGEVKEVYEVSKWDYDPTPGSTRIIFEGHPAIGAITGVKGYLLPKEYRKRGCAAPFLYKK